MKYLITLIIILSVILTLSSQIPISQIEGLLEVYHSQDSTSMYIGKRAGSELEMDNNMHNTVIGNQTGIKISESQNNVIIGEKSGQDLHDCSENVFIGNQIATNARSYELNENVIMGFQAGLSMIEGEGNTIIGYQAGKNISICGDNTIVGSNAGQNITSQAYGNSIFGAFAGSDSLEGDYNNFFGLYSGSNTISGTENSFFGSYSGLYNTTGSSNIFLGVKAGVAFTSENDNILIGNFNGNRVIVSTGTGNKNTIIGNNTAINMKAAASNSILGHEAGFQLKNGENNIYVGHRSGFHNSDGNSNVFLGYMGGMGIKGSGNIAIGHLAGPPNSHDIINNKLFIDNKTSDQPLIYGEFDNNLIQINGILKSQEIYLESTSSDDGIIRSDTSKSSSDLFLKSNDKVIIDLDTNDDENSSFSVRNSSGGTIFNLLENGNLSVDGTLVHTSDINRKYDISEVNTDEILEKVQSLDIATWKYKGSTETHLGPMAQDFHAAFGLGEGDTTIATVDADGIALAAIKALATENEILKNTIKSIQSELSQIKKKINEK